MTKEYFQHLKFFTDDPYRGILRGRIPAHEWGNRKVAEDYLDKYWLPRAEYKAFWKSIQDNIFIYQKTGLPDLGFREGLKILPIRGGIMFEEESFRRLQLSLKYTGDRFFVIIQTFYEKSKWGELTPFMLKYPANITWEELKSGNYISAVLFDFPANEYFIFGDSGKWGEYVASDYIHPLNILAFREEYASIFRENFKVSQEEWEKILKWLPDNYEKYL